MFVNHHVVDSLEIDELTGLRLLRRQCREQPEAHRSACAQGRVHQFTEGRSITTSGVWAAIDKLHVSAPHASAAYIIFI